MDSRSVPAEDAAPDVALSAPVVAPSKVDAAELVAS